MSGQGRPRPSPQSHRCLHPSEPLEARVPHTAPQYTSAMSTGPHEPLRAAWGCSIPHGHGRGEAEQAQPGPSPGAQEGCSSMTRGMRDGVRDVGFHPLYSEPWVCVPA